MTRRSTATRHPLSTEPIAGILTRDPGGDAAAFERMLEDMAKKSRARVRRK